MFRTKKPNPTQHFPYKYEAPVPLRVKTPVHGGKWLLEILAAGIIVIGLLIGGALLFNHLHAAKTPSATTSTSVQQSPQTNQQKKPTNAPVSSPQAGTTNSGNVNRPSGQ